MSLSASTKKLINSIEEHKPTGRQFYSIRSILGNANWAAFYILLGARQAGKSYSVMEYFVRKWKQKGIPFTWLRLNEASMKKMLVNKAEKLVDPDLYRKYDLDLTVKGNNVYDHGKRMATVLALSTFANDKGVALFDKDFLDDPDMYYHICLDEFQLEKTQRSQGDICYQFIQQLENQIRNTSDKVKIFLIGNTLEEASDILTLFNYIPEEFGRYKIKRKRCVLDYIAPTEAYKAMRKNALTNLLAGNESNFTNELIIDKSLVDKRRLIRPQVILQFTKTKAFTIWNDGIIAEYNGESCKTKIAMRPYIDLLFNPAQRDEYIELFDSRAFHYHDLMTFKKFQHEIQLLKPRAR